ncbi:MAG TPA: rod shape-determining protein RodA [Gammaproteobacteria bacterium]|nr:rod shape-determining protein RodA [Gammaproteobacteria bacterium]
MSTLSQKLHIDLPLLGGLLLVSLLSFVVLYSAGGQSNELLIRHSMRLLLAFTVMIVLAQIPVRYLAELAPWLFGIGLLLLIAVLLFGDSSKGAQRWLDLKVFRFQPSEIMKLAVPMMIAWYLSARPLPPRLWRLAVASVMIAVPAALVAKQPDLGTALLIASAGVFVLLLSGIRWRLVGACVVLAAGCLPIAWHFLRDYQRDRILTFLNPENDPLGAGYHIIQSTIAIGSGGLYGKGWLNGTQSYLDFLPERTTDFIFAVYGEEFGLIGILVLLMLYLFIVARGLYISLYAQDSFARLLGSSLTLTFFIYVFVNIGMVTGLMPVVGVPLPLISYGGTSLVTLMAAFGILMSIQTHRKLMSR